MAMLFDNEDGIPSSIWMLILSFLSFLDVIKLSAVSKNWKDSIRSLEFLNFYNQFGPTPSREFLLQGVFPFSIKNDKALILISERLQDSLHQTVLVPHKSIGAYHDYELVGSTRGILCLQRWDEDYFCLFVLTNPLTGQFLETRYPVRKTPRVVMRTIFGFGYDTHRDCYIIVLIREVLLDGCFSHSCVSFFSSSNREWSPEFRYPYSLRGVNERSVNVDGKICWFVCDSENPRDDDVYFVLSFYLLNHVLIKGFFLRAGGGVCQAIIPVDDKIGGLFKTNFKAPSSRYDYLLWMSESDFLPTGGMILRELYLDFPMDYKFVGSLGAIVIFAP